MHAYYAPYHVARPFSPFPPPLSHQPAQPRPQPMVQQPNKKGGRKSSAEKMNLNKRVCSAATKYFALLPLIPSVNAFCRANNLGGDVRKALGILINSEPLLKNVKDRWSKFTSQIAKEAAGIISSSPYFESSKRRKLAAPPEAETASQPASAQNAVPPASARTERQPTPHAGPASPFWESKKARYLYGLWNPSVGEETDLYAIVENRAERR